MRAVQTTATEFGGEDEARGRGKPLALPQTDWLLGRLTISGPAGGGWPGSGRRRAAPWHFDLDEEEARLFAPMASGGIEARVLARELREIIDARHDRVLIGRPGPGTCPLDLHRLVPIPRVVLQPGEHDPSAWRWL